MSWIVRIPISADSKAESDRAELVSTELWDLGTSGVAEVGEELLAGFDDRDLANEAAASFDGSVEPVDPSVWAVSENSSITVNGTTLTLEVGTAFGHGEHPTTRLVLDAIESEADHQQFESVLDVGCGTGVLALAAAVLGAKRIIGLDIDPDAVAIARRNAGSNGDSLQSAPPTFSTIPVGEVDGAFDLVVANLLLADIRPLTASIIELLDEADGRVIVSGSMTEQRDELLAAFDGMRIRSESQADGWLCLILER